jgi:hypothetical protein
VKTAGAVRREAANICAEWARQCERDGDLEGVTKFRDAASAIRAIVIRSTSANSPWRDTPARGDE